MRIDENLVGFPNYTQQETIIMQILLFFSQRDTTISTENADFQQSVLKSHQGISVHK